MFMDILQCVAVKRNLKEWMHTTAFAGPQS